MRAKTKRQREVLEYITEFVSEHGYEPSYQQIARALGLSSKSGIANHISALEKQGLLLRTRKDGSFSLNLRSEVYVNELVTKISWLDITENNKTTETEQNPIYLSKTVINSSKKNIFAFRVFDDAMIDKNICEGDIALVDKKIFARDRDIVIAIADNEPPVLHSYHRKGGEIELRPANKNYKSIILRADKIEILAILKGLIRPYI